MNIECKIPLREPVRYALLSLAGVGTLAGVISEGSEAFRLEAGDLPDGWYVLHLQRRHSRESFLLMKQDGH